MHIQICWGIFISKIALLHYCNTWGSLLEKLKFSSPLGRYCPPIPRNDDRIHRYILPRTTAFPQYQYMVQTSPSFYCREG
jgi:hypothetical protein